MKEKAFLAKKEVSKEGFESIILFLSSYAKARDMNSKLQDLFTIVEERNSESEYKGVLQFKERLKEFVEYTTELTDFAPYYEYFSVDKEKLKGMDCLCQSRIKLVTIPGALTHNGRMPRINCIGVETNQPPYRTT